MLPKYKGKIDTDGYLMLLLSVLVIFSTAGISYLIYLRKTFLSAKNTKTYCQNNKMICVLGKKLFDNKPDDEYLLRLERACNILDSSDSSEVLLLGGKTGNAIISEASAGKEYLLRNSIDESRIHLEENSRNTLENFINAIDLLRKKDKEIVVVSNRYHLARAKQLAVGLGLKVELCAAEDNFNMNASTLFKLLLEALHVHWYTVGRKYAHITKNNRIIKRVG